MNRLTPCAVILLAATALPAAAHGHAEDSLGGDEARIARLGRFHARLDETPARRGLAVRLLDGPVVAIFVRNSTGRRLAVPGRAGEPFLRISRDGVEANLRSPTYYRAARQSVREVPRGAGPVAQPRWKRISREPAWAWLEYRARTPRRPRITDRRSTVLRWTTPMSLGGEPLRLRGHVEWVPAAATGPRRRPHSSHPISTRPPLAPGAPILAGALALALATFVRQRLSWIQLSWRGARRS